jgi:hypothetical protein
MPNIYLEKIALTIEDTRAARKSGDAAERKVRLKGAGIGAAVGGVTGGGLAYHFGKKMIKDPIFGQGLRSTGLSNRKLQAAVAGAGVLTGALFGAASGDEHSYGASRKKKVDAYHARINKALTKSAAVTKTQVEARVNRNDALRDVSRVGGFVAGTAGVGGLHLHKAMKNGGGYAATKDAMRNAYHRRKSNPEKKIDKGSFLTKLEDIKPSRSVAKHIDRSGIARKVGNSFGSSLSGKGLAGVAAGALLGSYAASKSMTAKNDKSDVNYYSKLSKKNG